MLNSDNAKTRDTVIQCIAMVLKDTRFVELLPLDVRKFQLCSGCRTAKYGRVFIDKLLKDF